jgi:hypothetical protein
VAVVRVIPTAAPVVTAGVSSVVNAAWDPRVSPVAFVAITR